MAPHQLLRYQLLLLVAASGKQQVLATLAKIVKLAPEELEAALADIEKLEASIEKKPKAEPSSTPVLDPIETIIALHPDKAEVLKTLVARFASKALLPELRDVRRFLDEHAQTTKSLKSRSDALPKVLKVLAQLELRELKELCERPDSRGHSALGIISDEIMKRDRR